MSRANQSTHRAASDGRARRRDVASQALSPAADTMTASALHGVRALVGGMRRSARAIESSVGLSNAQLFLLEQMAADGPHSVAALGRRLHVRANTISMTVAKLVERGLARRTVGDDRRRVLVAITPQGRRLLGRAPEPPTTRLLTALEAMPPRDLRALVRGLESLAAAMRLDPARAPLMFEETASARNRRANANAGR